MSKTTTTQQLRRLELEALAEHPLRDAAQQAFEQQVEHDRAELARLAKAVLGRTPETFPDPHKYGNALCTIDGLSVGLSWAKSGPTLALLISCPDCGDENLYAFSDYASLGSRLRNATIDSRCSRCQGRAA